MVKALASILAKYGIECVTIGRNEGRVEQVDDAIVQVLKECDCLVGLATARFEAVDVDDRTKTLKLATSYLVGESAMAHFAGMPWMLFRARGVDVMASAARNLYVDIENDLGATGNVRLVTRKAVVDAMITDLRTKALARRSKRKRSALLDGLAKGAAIAAAGYTAYRVVDAVARPDCYGDFYYADAECKPCGYQADCRAEKARCAAAKRASRD